MERLTEKHYLGTDHYMTCSGNCNVDMDCIDCPSFDRLVERLAAYEDTGLTPEDCARATEIDDILLDEYYPIGRMRELIKADKDGRVVVLPCKVGDTVWAILDGAKYARECKVDFVNIGSFGTTIVFVVKDGLREQYGVTAAAFVKTVFLTREEAEKALEAMNNG
mgnify:CR=1 FL=1|jgi:hypothetical protein